MDASLVAGESLSLPCKHCLSLSLGVTLEACDAVFSCAKCSGRTRVVIRSDASGWSFASELLDEPEPD